MAKRRDALRPDNTGQYYRQIGYKLGPSQKRVQPKFRLGADRPRAEFAYHRLGLLWDAVVAEYAEVTAGRFPSGPPASEPDGALWTDATLQVAEAVRKGQHTLKVYPPEGAVGGAAYLLYLDALRQRYGHVIQLVAGDAEAAEEGRSQHQHFAEHRARQSRVNARVAGVPAPAGLVGTRLHQALEAYAVRSESGSTNESGRVEAANARRLKNAVADVDLSEFGFEAMDRIRAYWAARPEAKGRGGRPTGRRISITTVDNHLSTARRFVRWLDRSDAYKWEMPRHGLDALRVNLARLRTDAETAGRRLGVRVFTVEQLATMYRHATDFERLLLLLGLNAAMAQAEVITLRWDEVEAEPPAIKRVRRKSGVYGEFALWPETARALDWWRRTRGSDGELVMVTTARNPYTRQRISNAWATLARRISSSDDGSSEPSWWLSYKHLRKTAAQLVRDASDGEVAGVFLSHGQPVASDELADVYSNRPFGRVTGALSMVRERLEPVFVAAPEAFSIAARGGRRTR